MKVLFYPERMRTVDDIELWQQTAEIGELVSENPMIVKYMGRLEEVPKKYVRAVRQERWYAFWRSKGFHTNLYAYALVIIFFLVFIK